MWLHSQCPLEDLIKMVDRNNNTSLFLQRLIIETEMFVLRKVPRYLTNTDLLKLICAVPSLPLKYEHNEYLAAQLTSLLMPFWEVSF